MFYEERPTKDQEMGVVDHLGQGKAGNTEGQTISE